MKKNYLVLCMMLLTSFVSAQSTDMSVFGFKSEVKEAVIKAGSSCYGIFYFSKNGSICEYPQSALWSAIKDTDGRAYSIDIDKRTPKSIEGSCYHGQFNATVANNKITKIVITEDGVVCHIRFV